MWWPSVPHYCADFSDAYRVRRIQKLVRAGVLDYVKEIIRAMEEEVTWRCVGVLTQEQQN